MKPRLVSCILLLFAVDFVYGKSVIQAKEETIAGIPVKVVREYRSSFDIQFIILVIAEESYSKENLISILRHYCEKYDKKIRLDLRVYLNRTYEYNQQFAGLPVNMHTGEVRGPDGTGVKLRGYEAYFERKGDGALAYGGDNELMIYSPNLDEPEKKESIWLAGKNANKQ